MSTGGNPSGGGLTTDAARFEIVKNALIATAEEMKIVLAKTAYSPLLKVAGDYSCGIFDVAGNMVAQGPDLPIHLGSMPDAVRAVVAAFPDVAPGDVFIHNDPYQGGSHLPDVNVVAPAFHGSRLLGFGCVRAHWPDIGSATPGSYGAVTEVYGEGLRLPPVRLYREGQPVPGIEAIIFANVRTPDERRGDLAAQVAANRRAGQRLAALAEKYGADSLLAIMQEVQDYSERMMRAALLALPDGEASFTDVFDGDGVFAPGESEDEPFRVSLRLVKRGDSIIADFAGSDPAVAGPMNAPLTVTASGVYCALKMIADPNSLIPPNSGCWRPVTVSAPAGSVVNAQHPSPVVYANHEMSHRIADMVMGAMFAISPRTVMAGSQG
ncbi:MAG: hydantoinase B/oxoprolinase family protein, partial [Acetobacteraceae bacterium]